MEKVIPRGPIGIDTPRIDARAKVTGAARYGADQPVPHPAFAHLVTSPIAVGRITAIDDSAARAVPGVLDILTHKNVGHAVKPGKPLLDGGHMATSVAPLYDDSIHFHGQIVAVVIADTLEIAHAAAPLVAISYEARPPTATFDCPSLTQVKAKTIGEAEISAGHFAKAFAESPITLDQWYETPPQHHNPLELFQATCAWDGDHLTVWESSQSVTGYQYGLATQLGISPKQIRIISPFIGGAFGSRGELAQSTALIAFAAKRLQRPVKFVATRRQGFTLRTFRAETRHHLRLGATPDGHLLAMAHEGWELTGRDDRFALAGIEATTRLYDCHHVDARVHNVQADRQTPGFMRAPPELPYMFALESAIDELAHTLNMDPVELRRRNDSPNEPIKGIPFSSRSLMQCFDAAAAEFGWSNRDPRPGSMRDGDWLVGWGCASAMYPAQIAPATCRVTLTPDPHAIVDVGAHDIGTGLYTILAQTAADLLGLSVDAITVNLGDSDLPAAPLTAGSSGTASIATVVAKACQELRATLAHAATTDNRSPLHGLDPKTLFLSHNALISPSGHAEPLALALQRVSPDKPLSLETSNNPAGAPPLIGPMLVRKGLPIIVSGNNHKDYVRYAFGAHFVEIRLHRTTGELRAPRLVGAFAAGRIMNPRTAKSQLMGGQVWGLSSALLEATELDLRRAAYVNSDLAEYLLPTAADVPSVTTLLIPEDDPFVNPLGIKGVGELGIVGLNAAVANAVFHATGTRFRKLPIRLSDALLQSPALQSSKEQGNP